MEFYEDFLKRNRGGDYLKLIYEELYSEDMLVNIETINRISKFLNITPPPTEIIEKYMKPSISKVNDQNLYSSIPNYNEIIKQFGNNQ